MWIGKTQKRLFLILALSFFSSAGFTTDLLCPMGYEDPQPQSHQNESWATSSPEIKVRADAENSPLHWAKTVRPLSNKAISLAKTKRASEIEKGIENACKSPKQYISRLIENEETSSSCEHRVVTRASDPDHVWLQVVANCKYEWRCCQPQPMEESKNAHPPNSNVSYTLEGPLGVSTSAPFNLPSKQKYAH